MCVPHEHPGISMPTDMSHLWNAQAHLEESADRLMPEVVVPEVRQGHTGAEALWDCSEPPLARLGRPLIPGTAQGGTAGPHRRCYIRCY
jgi:hypothetical protein